MLFDDIAFAYADAIISLRCWLPDNISITPFIILPLLIIA